MFGKHSCYDLLPPPSLLLGFLGVQLAHLLSWMLTVQNSKKSSLARKPACSLIDNAPLTPRLPPSGSGCPRLPVSLSPASGGGFLKNGPRRKSHDLNPFYGTFILIIQHFLKNAIPLFLTCTDPDILGKVTSPL